MFLSDDKQTLWLTPQEMANLIEYFTGYPVSYRTLHRRISAGVVPATRRGNRWLVDAADLSSAARATIPEWYVREHSDAVLGAIEVIGCERRKRALSGE